MAEQSEADNARNGSDSASETTPVQRLRKPVSREGVEKLMQFQDQLLQEHGGKPFESSVELIREQREERMRELMGDDYTDD